MPPRQPTDPPLCAALLWDSNKQCDREAAPGHEYCPTHLALLTPPGWAATGYATKVDASAQPFLQSARFLTVSEELAVARSQLAALLPREHNSREVFAAIRTVANLVKLQHELEALITERIAQAQRETNSSRRRRHSE